MPILHGIAIQNIQGTFIENKGQWPESALFQAGIGNHRVWMMPSRIRYELIRGTNHPLANVHSVRHNEEPDRFPILAAVYDVVFEKAFRVLPIPASQPSSTRFNYYIGSQQRQWARNVPAFETVLYKELYPGVDMLVKAQDNFLKYDFNLKEGNNGSSIQMRFDGCKNLSLQNGRLHIQTALGVVEEHIPKAYQLIGGFQKVVACEYRLTGNVVSFVFRSPIDPKYPTVIDPQLNFFTYSGSGSDNWANTAISDAFGNSYTAGTVYGSSFPTTQGAFDRSYNGQAGKNPYLTYDIGILKFDPTGSQLLSCTFLGGLSSETPHSLSLDNDQNLIILGTTSSTNFPVSSNAFQRNHRGGPVEYPFGYDEIFVVPTYENGSDLFITRLSANGQNLLHSTYLGGGGTDGLMTVVENLVTNYGDQFRGDILVDEDGTLFLASHTHSDNLPLTSGYQPNLRGNMDGMVVRMSGDLSQILWGTYLGGSAEDALFSIKFLGASQIAVCGGSNSTNFPVSTGAYQPNRLGGGIDGVLAVFDKSNGLFRSGTYTGTVSYDQAYLLETDPSGSVYVFGQTSGTMPKTSGTFGSARGGQFIQKFTGDLRNLVWSTTIGTTPNQPNIVPTGFLVDSCQRIFISGWGGRVNYAGPGFAGGYTIGLPTSDDAIKSISSDSSDFYFLVLSKDARSMVYGTYLGGNSGRGEHVDGGTSRFDKKGVVTQAVCGCKDDFNNYFIGTPNAYQPNIRSSNCNNGVLKFNLFDLKAKFQFAGAVQCPRILSLSNLSENGAYYVWYFGNGDSLVSNAATISYTYPSPGEYIITLKAVNPKTCIYEAQARDTIFVPDPLNIPTSFPTDSFCVGDTLKPIFPELAPYQLSWFPQNYLNNPTSWNPVIVPLGSILYTISAKSADGCIAKSQYRVRNRKIDLGFGTEKTYHPCDGIYDVRLFSNRDSSDRYVWYIGASDSAVGPEVFRRFSMNGTVPIRLNGAKGNCAENAFDTLFLNDQKINILPSFSTSSFFEGCGQPAQQFLNTTQSATSFSWDFGDGSKSTEFEPRHQFAGPGQYEVKLEAFKDGCREVYVKKVDIPNFFVPNLITRNEDGRNEAFVIQGLQPNWQLEVFNRWGHKVFQTDSYDNNWTPDQINEGIYFFNIRFPGGGHCNSWLQVLKR